MTSQVLCVVCNINVREYSGRKVVEMVDGWELLPHLSSIGAVEEQVSCVFDRWLKSTVKGGSYIAVCEHVGGEEVDILSYLCNGLDLNGHACPP